MLNVPDAGQLVAEVRCQKETVHLRLLFICGLGVKARHLPADVSRLLQGFHVLQLLRNVQRASFENEYGNCLDP